jgi:predicted  nucleic acid-binding Zn-ribbon protein
MSAAEALLELQRIDTGADQLRHRREHLDERDRLVAVTAQVNKWESTRRSLVDRIAETAGIVEQAEAEGSRIDAETARLNAQMRTVIAPREAEALQHELATLAGQRAESDERGLVALTEQGEAEEALAAHLAAEESIREAARSADERLQIAESGIEAELAELEQRRLGARALLTEALLARYDRVRSKIGVAAARLTGSRCEGCHLDLSVAEVDEVRRAGDDEFPDCPQCGRMLVR